MERVFSRLGLEAHRVLSRLYLRDPCPHSYLYHDAFQEPEYTQVFIESRGARVESYLVLYYPPEALARRTVWAVAWGATGSLAGLVPRDKKVVLIVLGGEEARERYLESLQGTGDARERKMLFMERIVESNDYESFREVVGEVERVEPSDTGAIAEVSEIYRATGWAERATTLRLEAGRKPFYLLRPSPIGVGVATAYLCVQTPRAWMVCGLAVHPAYRGRGYASRLMDYIHGLAWASKAEKVCLLVDRDNEPAVRLYEKKRYRRRGEISMIVYTPM